jgi:protein involved in polysaccharide export with SLBB domain
MKRIICYIFLLMMVPMCAIAQSSMTDDQVMDMIVKEHNNGTPQTQIVTKLMQSGVDITQIRRVRNKIERQMKQSGLGQTSGNQQIYDNSRMRTNNGQTRDELNTKTSQQTNLQQNRSNYSNMGISDYPQWQQEYDPESEDFINMQDELNGIIPMDSTQMLEMLLAERKKKQNKVFGRDIFNNKNLTFEPEMNIATPQNYRLGPGDAVIVDIYGASQKTVNATVSPDGEITIEGYGPVQVSGLTVSQANAKLRSTLGSRYSSSRIKLTVGQTRTIMVNVMGEVKTPGTYTLSAFATVFHALYMAGGTNDLGTLRNIKVYRNNRLISVVDIYDYILNGKLTGNVRLADNDVIVVGPYDCLVEIRGKVKRPMFYEMKKTESVATLLKYAGGFTGDAYKKSVRVNRKTGRERSVFNVGEFDMTSFRVNDGDSVTVDSILPRYENTVEIKGAVFRPGMYNLSGEINSVRTLIEHAEGCTEDAFTAHAVMHRMKDDRTLKVISVDVDGIMSGKVADIPLQENDILFIPTKTTKMNERTITIRGEVQYPGIYQYADDESVEDFILQAGGLTDKASTAKVSVSRRVSDPAATQPDSIIGQQFDMALKDGFIIDGQPGFKLMPFDEVYVFKSPAYSEQQNVTIDGEVAFPGTYTITKRRARLTDLLKMAGGPTDMAYIKGARLDRKPNEEERKRMQAAYQMAQEQQQNELMELMANTTNGGNNIATMAENNKKTSLQKFQVPSSYPVGIQLDEALKNPQSDANIELREGDRLLLPRYNATVKINGAVMYPNTVAYERGKNAKHYINAAGGFAQNARKNSAYIIYMNGMVSKVSHGAKVEAGCEIVVPSKITRRTSPAEIATLGTSMASIATMIATIANMGK